MTVFYTEFEPEFPTVDQLRKEEIDKDANLRQDKSRLADKLFSVLSNPKMGNAINACKASYAVQGTTGVYDAIRGKGLFATATINPHETILELSFKTTVWSRTFLLSFIKAHQKVLYELLVDICLAINPEKSQEDHDRIVHRTFENERLLFVLVVIFIKSRSIPREPTGEEGLHELQWYSLCIYAHSLPSSLTTPVYAHVSSADDGSDKIASWNRLLLQGTDLAAALPLRIRSLDSEFKSWEKIFEMYYQKGELDSMVSLKEYVLVNGLVLSRVLSRRSFVESLIAKNEKSSEEALPIETSMDDDCFLAPVLDFCNHEFTPNATWKLDLERRVVLLEAGCRINAGDEITFCYGYKPNSELLWTYGFAIPDNPYDRASLLNLTLNEKDEWLFHFKRTLIQHFMLSKRVDLVCTSNAVDPFDMVDAKSKALLYICALDGNLVQAVGFGDLMRNSNSSAASSQFPYDDVVGRLPKSVDEFLASLEEIDLKYSEGGGSYKNSKGRRVLRRKALILLHQAASDALTQLHAEVFDEGEKQSLDTILDNKERYSSLIALLVYRKGREHLLQQVVQASQRTLVM